RVLRGRACLDLPRDGYTSQAGDGLPAWRQPGAPMRRLWFLAGVLACDVGLTSADGGIRATTILAPDQTEFTTVSPVFERRCGTLDCHVQAGRPLRIFSGLGLRLPNDAGDTPGQGATTPDEIVANYRSVIGL